MTIKVFSDICRRPKELWRYLYFKLMQAFISRSTSFLPSGHLNLAKTFVISACSFYCNKTRVLQRAMRLLWLKEQKHRASFIAIILARRRYQLAARFGPSMVGELHWHTLHREVTGRGVEKFAEDRSYPICNRYCLLLLMITQLRFWLELFGFVVMGSRMGSPLWGPYELPFFRER